MVQVMANVKSRRIQAVAALGELVHLDHNKYAAMTISGNPLR